MGNRKMDRYLADRADGLRLAYNCYTQKGMDALLAEKEFREVTGITLSVFEDGFEDASVPIRSSITAGHNIIWRAVLHDQEDFGRTRINRVYNRVKEYDKKTRGLKDAVSISYEIDKSLKKVLKKEIFKEPEQKIKRSTSLDEYKKTEIMVFGSGARC